MHVIGLLHGDRAIPRIISALPGLFAVISFSITQDLSGSMVMVDQWTLVMAAIVIIEIAFSLVIKLGARSAKAR